MAVHALAAQAAAPRAMSQARLLDRVEELEEEVRQLRAVLVPPVLLPLAWGLTASESTLLRILMAAAPKVGTFDRILAGLYDDRDHTPEPQIISVFAMHVRRKLRQAGVEVAIENVRDVGYRISAEELAALRAAIAAEARR